MCIVQCGYNCTGQSPDICNTTCGDGVLAGEEECDDENTADVDGCSSTCTKEIGWDCTDTTCRQTSCTAICGDGLKVGIEACDDGNNTYSGDGCSAVCTVDCGYTCSTNDGVDGASTCVATSCGDGVVVGSEECDDSDLASEDGCSSSCVIDFGWKCSNPVCGPSTCLWQTGNEACGDGFTLGGEEGTLNFCDDGDTTPGDGCSAECQIECGYKCDGGLAGAADTCTARCGNLVKTGDEGCDDGNSIDNDGCSSCAIDDGYSCLESDTCSPSSWSEVCGDGTLHRRLATKPAMITTLLLVMDARMSAPWSLDLHVMAQDHKAVIQPAETARWPATRPATTATRPMTLAALRTVVWWRQDGHAPTRRVKPLPALTILNILCHFSILLFNHLFKPLKEARLGSLPFSRWFLPWIFLETFLTRI